METRKSAVRDLDEHGKGKHKRHVGNTVEDQQSLHDDWETTRGCVGPEGTCSVDGSEHEKIRKAHFMDDVAPSWHVNLNWERWTLVGRVDAFSSCASPEHVEGAEQPEALSSVALEEVAALQLVSLQHHSKTQKLTIFLINN